MSGPRMMVRAALLLGSAGLMAGVALAQQGPESLLPPGFDRPARAPRPARPPAPKPAEAAPRPAASQRAPASISPGFASEQPAPAASASPQPGLPAVPAHVTGAITLPEGVTSFDQLMALPPDRLDELLGLRPKYDIPPAAQRSLTRVGIIDAAEGGLPPLSLAQQSGDLVRAALTGNQGQLVSRWGHILLRRVLASRLDAPAGMDGAQFAALRAALLLRMGEADASRALVQDVDPDNYTPDLAQSAFNAYVATGDFTGFCPVLDALDDGAGGNDPQWQAERAICQTFGGNPAAGLAVLDHLQRGDMARIDVLLAQKYAGAAGMAGRNGRRAVKIEWDGVDALTPWRFGLAVATGLTPPAKLMADGAPGYDYLAASAPALGLGVRADASDLAGGAGILSASAMVDLYSQVYDADDITGGPADRALQLRDAYLAASDADRLKAMQKLWDGAAGPQQRYGRLALTAYAAARLTPSTEMAGAAPDILAAMLAAGLDANAARWQGVVERGGPAWGILAVGLPGSAGVDAGLIDDFAKADPSEGKRRSAFLAAGLAGLGRISADQGRRAATRLGASLDGTTRWTQAIDAAAAVGNPALVALLAGLGMQGNGWAAMTPRYLYHIVAALNHVGLSAEARMIAAEAVARG